MGKSRRFYGDKEPRPVRKTWTKQNRRAVTQQLDEVARRYNLENENHEQDDGRTQSDNDR